MSVVPCRGFADPVHDSQRAFRGLLEALSRPGTLRDVGAPIAGLPLGAAMAHLLLALTDETTPVWWEEPHEVPLTWLRFHTGARRVNAARDSLFAVVTSPARLPALDSFAQGRVETPELSTTLLVEVPSLEGGTRLEWHGPGIAQQRVVGIDGLPPAFWAQWQANHAAFPQGVDVVFTCGARAVGLPRTTRVRRLEGV